MTQGNGPGFSAAQADLRTQLAGLDALEVRQQAKDLAVRYGITRGDVLGFWRLEHRSAAAGAGEGRENLGGRPIGDILKPAEPWPDPVDGAAWLEECDHELRRYLAMPKGAHETVAAYCFYTHAYHRFGYAPYVAFQSPAPECGKTTALRGCSLLARLPLFTGSMTTATLFRVVDEHHPVLLCDEQDGRLERNEELRLLFNEGFQRGSHVLRCVGDNNEPRGFDCFGPKILACIGSLPATIESRSLIVLMERSRAPLEELHPLAQPEALVRLRRQAARWARDHAEQLGAIPEIPGFAARVRDKAGPLLAVAEAAGAGWLARIASAVQALAAGGAEDAEHLLCLADVGYFLAGCGWPSFVKTESILRALNAMPDAPWSEMGKSGLSGHKLAALLRILRIYPEDQSQRDGDGLRQRGYRTAQIRRVFGIYAPGAAGTDVPEVPVPMAPPPHSENDSAGGFGPEAHHRSEAGPPIGSGTSGTSVRAGESATSHDSLTPLDDDDEFPF